MLALDQLFCSRFHEIINVKQYALMPILDAPSPMCVLCYFLCVLSHVLRWFIAKPDSLLGIGGALSTGVRVEG